MPRVRLKSLLAWMLGISLLLGGCRFISHIVLGPVIPWSVLSQVKPGMTKGEVRELLGKPDDVEGDDWQWEYERPFNPGWVEIFFDEEGRVTYVNDESVTPLHPR